MPHPRGLIRAATALAAALTFTAVLPAASAQAAAPAGVIAVAGADCAASRLTLNLVNTSTAAQTYTVTWPGRSGSPWTRTVPAGGSFLHYWTLAPGTAYNLRTTTPTGLDTTAAGIFHCGTGMSALTSMDCTAGRLQLTLENRTGAATTFTTTWPGRSGSPWTTTVAAGGNAQLYWTVPAGTAYTLRTTATGFDLTNQGTATCGLADGTPKMNAVTVLTTQSVIRGLNGPSGAYDGTVASVRIPGMAVTNNGTVIAVADARVNGSYDLGGGDNNIQIAMMRSTDGGASFEQPRIIHHAATVTEGVGDPSVLVDRTTGAVYVFFTYSPRPGISYWSAGSGVNTATDPDSLHLRYIKSTDHGATWGAPVELNPQAKDPAWKQVFFSSGHGIQTSSGRLIQPVSYRDANGVSNAGNVYSDDHGATWRRGGSAGAAINESKAVERGTGAVVQNMRHDSVRSRYYSTSTDGGVTFGAATANSLLPDPGCNADELSYLRPSDVGSNGAPARTSTVLFSNNASSSARNNLTVRLSTDNGATWPTRALLKPGAAGYSTMAVLADGQVADLYEIGNTGGIIFTRFSLDWVRGA
ncbi:exo-alpha-sialidase [Dactylosporangium sp. NPDC049742]|uniref:exo-alpha-sialidase n=1 Tax=Dactylosporangium sp. NPDC049742 TaxID=3154737 RepID=UPI00341C3803